VVRLSVPTDISERMLNRLIAELEVDPERDVYYIEGSLGSSCLFELMALDRPNLKYPPHVPKIPEVLAGGQNIFAAIRAQDIMIHLPFDSFTPVEEFFRGAARDPDVLAIKATLYRVGKNAPVVDALMEARDNDKQVAVLVELKARFDEENNLEWARALEHKGVHVTYGVEELPVKTHSKIALVVRREADGVRRYLHLGTGNYNASTARLYTDLGLLTCNEELTDDATHLFNRLTGYAPATTYRRLLVAPEYLYPGFITLIDNEIQAALEGKPARLIFKMNQLEEESMIQKLYQASQAGVRIDLIVRGLCCLRPGIPEMSENIRVVSIIGRFLEHSRIYYFHNAPLDQQVYVGSADLMRRNLHNRVETVFPILDQRIRRRMLHILATNLRDNFGAWELMPDGRYQRLHPGPDENVIDSQYIFTNNSQGLEEMP
jgi:polyphosphate kinase